MADPHLVLAPLIEPPLPPVPAPDPAGASAWHLPGLWLPAGLVLLVGLFAWWRRRAPQRALRRIARQSEPAQAARQLAQWQRRHGTRAGAEWLATLDRLRFGPANTDAHDTLRRLCAEAATFPGRR